MNFKSSNKKLYCLSHYPLLHHVDDINCVLTIGENSQNILKWENNPVIFSLGKEVLSVVLCCFNIA